MLLQDVVARRGKCEYPAVNDCGGLTYGELDDGRMGERGGASSAVLCAANTLVNRDNLLYSYVDTTVYDYRIVMRQTKQSIFE